MTDQVNEIVPGVTKFGKWTAQGVPFKKDRDGLDEEDRKSWSATSDFLKVKCVCGEVRDIYLKNLTTNRSKSCGACATNRKLANLESRLREVIDGQNKEIRQITANVENMSLVGPSLAPTPQPVVKPKLSIPLAPVAKKEAQIEVTRNDGDLAELVARVESMLDPNLDDSPWSVTSLERQVPPVRYRPNPTLKELQDSFEDNDYFMTPEQLFSVHQAISQGKPILSDGPPGTGKTTLAEQIALAMGLDYKNPMHFHQLFCTADISKAESLYGWNDSKRLQDMQLVTRIAEKFPIEASLDIFAAIGNNSYSSRYLDIQSILRACVIPYRTVVLVDEVDKTYPEFDNYLLDVLNKNSFEVPGYGKLGRPAFNPKTSPIFIFTTNRERELSRALQRRMKPVWFDYLPEKLEAKVVKAKCGLDEMLAGKAAQFFYKLRSSNEIHFHQPPSTAEVIETCQALSQDGLDITPGNLFRYHLHWVKFRRDFDSLRDKYFKLNKWSEVI